MSLTDESMAITIGRCNEEIDDWLIDNSFEPNEPNEIGTQEDGLQYILGARSFYANNLSVVYSAATEPNRKAGEIDKKQMYKTTGPLSCKIDIEYYISSNHYGEFGDPYSFMRDDIPCGNATGQNFFPITIGRNIYNKCYLDSVSIDIKPYAPVVCRASFRATAPPSGVPLEGVYTAQKDYRSNNQLMFSDNFVFGNTCELSGWFDNLVDIKSIKGINFSRTYGRKDIYCLGEEIPRESLVKNVENSMAIMGTGIKSFIPVQGLEISGDLGIIMKDASGIRASTTPVSGQASYPIDLCMKMSSGSYVTAERFSVRGGGVVETEITVSEVLL